MEFGGGLRRGWLRRGGRVGERVGHGTIVDDLRRALAPGHLGPAQKATNGQTLPSVRCHDFGYLVSGNGCCDDAEDSLLEVLGGDS
jgi:hypothetical protein